MDWKTIYPNISGMFSHSLEMNQSWEELQPCWTEGTIAPYYRPWLVSMLTQDSKPSVGIFLSIVNQKAYLLHHLIHINSYYSYIYLTNKQICLFPLTLSFRFSDAFYSLLCCVYTWLLSGDHVTHRFYKLSIYQNEMMWFPTLFYYSALLPPLPPACVCWNRETGSASNTHTIKWRVMKLYLWSEQMEGCRDGEERRGGEGGGRVHSVFLWEHGKFY